MKKDLVPWRGYLSDPFNRNFFGDFFDLVNNLDKLFGKSLYSGSFEETDEAYILEAEMPGFKENEINAELTGTLWKLKHSGL